MTWLYLAGAVLCELAATLSLKGSASAPLLYAVVVVGYIAAFVLLAKVLKRGMGIGTAYGIWGAAGVALTAILSAIAFGERFTVLMGFGIVCIIAGVLLVESGSHDSSQPSATSPTGA